MGTCNRILSILILVVLFPLIGSAQSAAMFNGNVVTQTFGTAMSTTAGSGTAVIGTGATPSVMVPANAFTQMFTYVVPSTFHVPGYPLSTRIVNNTQGPGTFVAANPNAPTAATTVVPPAATTQFANAYQPRYGSMMVTPGPNRFGGTMDIFMNGQLQGRSSGTAGTFDFVVDQDPASAIPRVGPAFLGSEAVIALGQYTNTAATSSTFMSRAFGTGAPWTTGMATVMQPAGLIATTYTSTGADNRTPTNFQAGTLSLVSPALTQVYAFIPGFGSLGNVNHAALMSKVTLTFVPEPGAALMAGAGVMAVVLLALRRRS